MKPTQYGTGLPKKPECTMCLLVVTHVCIDSAGKKKKPSSTPPTSSLFCQARRYHLTHVTIGVEVEEEEWVVQKKIAQVYMGQLAECGSLSCLREEVVLSLSLSCAGTLKKCQTFVWDVAFSQNVAIMDNSCAH